MHNWSNIPVPWRLRYQPRRDGERYGVRGVESSSKRVGRSIGKPVEHQAETLPLDEATADSKFQILCFQEKLRGEQTTCPYHKPTQVG